MANLRERYEQLARRVGEYPVENWADDALVWMAEAATALASPGILAGQDVCGAERCVCGHFHCAHTGQYRGGPSCDDCECLRFKSAAPSAGPAPTEPEDR